MLSSSLACRGQPAAPAAPPPVPVTVAPVEARDVPETVFAVGSVQPYLEVGIRPLVTGAIVGVFFREGQEVRVGQRLFEIDPRPYRAALGQAEGALARARAQAANARADERRFGELVKKDYVTRQQYESARATAAADDADVAAAEDAVRRARLDLANCEIAAPIPGRTGAVLVQLGNVVQANQQAALVTIAQIRPVYVAFTVPEQVLPRVRQAGSTLPVFARSGDQTRRGTLSFVNNAVDPTTGTILLKATFPNQDEALWPGQYVDVRLQLGVRRNAMVAPASAVVTGQSGATVWVVRRDGTAAEQPVQVASKDADVAVISGGLQAGEQVVTDGQLRLVPGARVEVKRTAAPPQGAAPGGAEEAQAGAPAGPAAAAPAQGRASPPAQGRPGAPSAGRSGGAAAGGGGAAQRAQGRTP